MATELWQEPAGRLAKMIRGGLTTSREVVEAHLERIEAVNPAINAVVEVRADEVLEEADRADEARREGRPLGPLHGVPFTAKTNIDVAGYTTTQGTTALAGLVADSDAPVVERLRAAGAVLLARTNMPDLGLRINTESSLYGPAHNPWRHGRTTGGSSGGEAAALATGMSPLGLGNDIGGSLRNPAYACGVCSIKPSRGRVPMANVTDTVERPINAQLMLAEGVLARHIADVRAGLFAIMGSHPRDPQAVDVPLAGPPLARRVALVPEPAGGATDPGVAAGVRAAGHALEAAGYEVEEIAPPLLEETYAAWTELMMTSLAVAAPLIVPLLGEDGRRFLEMSMVDFAATPESLYAMHQKRFAVARSWRAFMEDHPLVVGPTWTQPPFEHGFDIRDAAAARAVNELFRFVLPANLLGLPAVCVPTGVTDGLPVGAQILAPRFRDDVCLDAGEAIERELGVITPIDPRP